MNTETLAAANAVRVAEATAETVPAVKAALDQVAAIAPDSWVDAGRLRVAHPNLSLADLGQLADPPLSKAAINGRLRNLLNLARKSRLASTPETEGKRHVKERTRPGCLVQWHQTSSGSPSASSSPSG